MNLRRLANCAKPWATCRWPWSMRARTSKRTGGSIAEYLDLYRSRPRELLTDAVAATWEISFERLQTEAPVALDLLYLIAFLAPDDIDPHLVSPAFPDALQFDQARGGLRTILADRRERRRA